MLRRLWNEFHAWRAARRLAAACFGRSGVTFTIPRGASWTRQGSRCIGFRTEAGLHPVTQATTWVAAVKDFNRFHQWRAAVNVPACGAASEPTNVA